MATLAAAPQQEYVEYSNATRWIILVALMLGTLMMVIDSSIVSVAMPTMMGNLGATLGQVSWVTTGYIIANVIVLPLTGWLTSRLGRRRYLAISLVTFTVASLLCGMARSLEALIIFRVIQGAGGAALMSTAQATLMEIFPPQQLGMVQAVFGVGIMVGPTLGPTLGGWIIDHFSWPWIFYINLPIGIIAVVLTLLFMHDSKYKHASAHKIDLIGIGFLAIGLGCLQTVLEKGNDEGWFQSPFIGWMSALALVGLAMFVIWELRIEHPAVNLRVLKHRGLAAGSLFGAIVGLGLFGGTFILPVFLQQLQHYTAQQSGFTLLPGALATAVLLPLVGALSSRYSPRILVFVGAVGFIISMYMLRTLTMDSSSTSIYGALVLRGASMGFLFVPLSLAALSGLRGQDIAEGTGLYSLFRQLGGSAGIAILTTFLSHRTEFHRAILLEHISAYNPLTMQRLAGMQQMLMSKGADATTAMHGAISFLDRIVQGQATILGFEDAFLLTGAIFVVSLPLLLLFEKWVPFDKRGGQKPEAPMVE